MGYDAGVGEENPVVVDEPSESTCRFGPVTVRYDERVLTPRSWTLTQSSWAAELAAAAPPGPLLELCAGAGHIGLAAAVLADRDLVQVEADGVAAGYARVNATAAGWGERVEVREQRLQVAVRPDERFPVVLADPPYLPTAEIARWPEDPVTAIDGGADGLALVHACLDVAGVHLAPGGWLLLQVAGPAQADAVGAACAGRADGLRVVDRRVIDDARAVVAIRAGASGAIGPR
ncbi:release factor glutamine methyltransferase [Jatrophihabitans endophyticus]|uniref:Release factor glutamine methyltransferase n=1 Tax=Jatrophihabitans endophyticus TaxID=1206085 RepID=A0A1M5E3U1_9ACTN|nr:RsmD family RNA methyltransferase [Jatrophihabitans endophyticus]SHF73732.1 release factor glutamine methyltransferase [Jatrophihabitans endophyticus]